MISMKLPSMAVNRSTGLSILRFEISSCFFWKLNTEYLGLVHRPSSISAESRLISKSLIYYNLMFRMSCLPRLAMYLMNLEK